MPFFSRISLRYLSYQSLSYHIATWLWVEKVYWRACAVWIVSRSLQFWYENNTYDALIQTRFWSRGILWKILRVSQLKTKAAITLPCFRSACRSRPRIATCAKLGTWITALRPAINVVDRRAVTRNAVAIGADAFSANAAQRSPRVAKRRVPKKVQRRKAATNCPKMCRKISRWSLIR